jgi:REP element-mobilizing transposase RayT
VLYKELRPYLGAVFRSLTEQKECRVEEGHLMPDHVHMLLSVPPKYAVSQVVGLHQGQERDSSGSDERRATTQLCRAALLGEGLLRLNGGTR